ncbi:MAG: MarR family transcriptional regulator [Chloroflexaceae bacterium]|jgi:DNA-binding MarR family transcriptional regulator|nr:MarR family transcriptional regulator [Chloroflexaceae bacterium]
MTTPQQSGEGIFHQPELEAYTLLKQINSLLETYNRYDLRSEDLTVPQFAILSHATLEGVPLSEISSRMLCDNSNLTGIVDRLISKGLVERRPDPQDRRVSLICLTRAGAEKLQHLRPTHTASVRRRMRSLSGNEVQQLRDLLQTLYQGLQFSDEGSANDGRT